MSISDISTQIISIHSYHSQDLSGLVHIDTELSKRIKSDYWNKLGKRIADDKDIQCFVAKSDDEIIGYIIGEIRAYEFGQDPCAWVFSLMVLPDFAQKGIGKKLLAELKKWFRSRGMDKVRTMVSLEQDQMHRFFRSSGFVSGPYMQLEAEL